MPRLPPLETLETSCSSIQRPSPASAHVRLRSGAWLCVEASSASGLCKLLDQLDSAFVDSWLFEEAADRGGAATRSAGRSAPRLLLLVGPVDWPRAIGRARSINGDLPIVATSSSRQDEVSALNSGADLFCQLPLDWPVLDARLRALLRRDSRHWDARPPGAEPPLRLEPVGRVLYAAGAPVALSPREFDLILPLFERREHWVPRQRLLQAMGIDHKGCDSSLLRMHILNIRNKLGSRHWMLQSERTRGFLLTANPEHSAASGGGRLRLKKA